MTKTELVNRLAANTGLTKVEASNCVNSVFSIIEDAVEEGDSVVIPGFGSWKLKSRAERQGRNPKTGETITIPERKVVVFTVGKEFKDRVS
jgi:DNA-binding protein HU-beta